MLQQHLIAASAYGAAGVGASYLLNSYGGAAGAYSMRKLFSGATKAARLRRSSDNAEQDTSFAAGETDTAAVLAWAGAGDAYVTTMYDQSASASRNLTNATTGQQPQIVSSGSLLTDGTNTKPALKLDSDDKLSFSAFGTSASLAGNAAFSIFVVHRKTTSTAGCAMGWGDTGTSLGAVGLYDDGSTASVSFAGSNDFKTSVPTNNTLYLTSVHKSAGAINASTSAYRNGVSVATSGHSTSTPNIVGSAALILGQWANLATNKFQGNVLELLVFAGDQSANRVAIESNINSYYGIW